MVEVVVEYEYEAAHEDELTLRLGDIIKNVRRIEEEGWMEGDLNGRRGLFPDNFVKEVRKEPVKDEVKEVKEVKEAKEAKEAKEVKEVKDGAQPQRRSAGNVASLVQRISTYGIPAGGLGFQPRSSRKKKKRQCKVVFEYVPQNEDELELKVGDIIEITEEVEEGWWSGTMNGKTGLFPSNFVKEVEMNEEEEINDAPDDPATDSKDEAMSPTSPHPGNGVITQPKKIKGVGFGDIFQGGSVKLKVRLPSEAEDKKEKPIPSLPSAAKPTNLSTSDAQKLEKDGESKGKVKEYCKATFAYESTNQDELDIKEGDVIHVLSKDTGEPGWWRGEMNGKQGVFPDNFVVLLSESDKETLASKGSIKQSPKQEPEEKPKKPPPPSKSTVLKAEVPGADKKPPQPRPEDKVDRAIPEKPAKPAAPIVPPKKPVPPPGKGLIRPGSLTPRRPDKPLAPSPVAKHNGEVPHLRPKSDLEPTLPSKPKTLSGDWADKVNESDLMSFDDVSSTSEKLSHPTTSRPKMPGRRLPAQFGGHSPSKEASEKVQKTEEEEVPRPKSSETRKPSLPTPTPTVHNKVVSTPTPEPKPKAEVEEEKRGEMEELRTQLKELALSIELLKTQQTRELSELRNELDEERLKRVALQLEIEKLKKQVQST